MEHKPWHDISMDLIVQLPKSKGFDAIFVVIDRFSKMMECIPTRTDVSAKELATLFVNEIMCNRGHGIPKSIISDRDPRFISDFW